jgi:hypothetical protein
VVVEVGLTLVEPVAELEVKVPGVMEIVVAPEVDQLRVLLEPELIPVGLAVKELMVGLLPAGFTVIVSLKVEEPKEFLAVRV